MNSNLTEIVFLLDRSGSMAGLEKDTIRGFNSFIKRQTDMEGDVLVTTVLFDDKYELLWNGIDGKDVELTNKEDFVRGSTALLDAVGKTILDVGRRLSTTSEDNRQNKVLFVITTDGMENSSREFTYKKVRELVKHQQDKYNWEFIFLGANIDAKEEAYSMGIDYDNAFDFKASKEGVTEMYCMVSEAVMEKRSK